MSETEIVNKLSAIEKSLRKNGKATQAAIGFAIAAFMSNSIASTTGTMNLQAWIFLFFGAFWFLLNGIQWLLLLRK